jgi:hypothetical protein
MKNISNPPPYTRSVAQPGSALALGARGPRFESLYSDQSILGETDNG